MSCWCGEEGVEGTAGGGCAGGGGARPFAHLRRAVYPRKSENKFTILSFFFLN